MSRLTVALANLIVALAVLPGCARSADRSLTAQLDAVFREAHADGEFNGSVLITRDDAIVYQASFGSADHTRNLANAADTKFLAFSVNKPMTAILVFQLVESGKLRLDEGSITFFPISPAGRPVASRCGSCSLIPRASRK